MSYTFFFTFTHRNINQTSFCTLATNREKYNFKVIKFALNCFQFISLNFFRCFSFIINTDLSFDHRWNFRVFWLGGVGNLVVLGLRKNLRCLRSLRSSRINKNFCAINDFEKFYFFSQRFFRNFFFFFLFLFLGFFLGLQSCFWVYKNFCTVYNFKELNFL